MLRTDTSQTEVTRVRRTAGPDEATALRLAFEVAMVAPVSRSAVELRGSVVAVHVPAVVGWRLRIILFDRDSLERLERDPQRDVKIEYLQRDILRIAHRRSTWTYPHIETERRRRF